MKNWVVFRGKKCGARLELELGEVAAWWCHKLVKVNWRLKAFRDVGNMKNDEFGLFPDLQVFLFYYVNANALPIINISQYA
jgi:hypothetical protein